MHTCIGSIQTFSPSIMRILGIVRLAEKYQMPLLAEKSHSSFKNYFKRPVIV